MTVNVAERRLPNPPSQHHPPNDLQNHTELVRRHPQITTTASGASVRRREENRGINEHVSSSLSEPIASRTNAVTTSFTPDVENSASITRTGRQEQVLSRNPYQRNNTNTTGQSQSPVVSMVSSSRTAIGSAHASNPRNIPLDYSIISSATTNSSSTPIGNHLSVQPEPVVDLLTPPMTDFSVLPTSRGMSTPFLELWDLLSRAVSSESIYQQIFGKIYVVPNLKQIGNKLYFNIEKKSKRSSVAHNKSDKVS
jgi:hypothetical protein